MKLYIVHASNTAVLAPSFVGVFRGREEADRVAREQSRNGREAAVIRQADRVIVAAFHSGLPMAPAYVYVNYPACYPEMYGCDQETLEAAVARIVHA